MALFPLKLYNVSKVAFVCIIIIQGFLLSKYLVDHYDSHGYFASAAVFIVVSLFLWIPVRWVVDPKVKLENSLGIIWLFYMVALVAMICWIYGGILIKHDKLREEIAKGKLCNNTSANNTSANNTSANNTSANNRTSKPSDTFFDSKFLKITLCFTPGEMLLLLTSVSDHGEVFERFYLTIVLDLFDGVEMLEVLHEDVSKKVPMGWEVTILAAASLYFLLSFLEIQQVKFDDNDQEKKREVTKLCNTVSQIILNLSFLVIRLVLWFKYDFDSAIFIAKNVISLVIALVPVLESECCGITCITRES